MDDRVKSIVNGTGDADWVEYKRLVLAELERLNEGQEMSTQAITDLRIELIQEISKVTSSVATSTSKVPVMAGLYGAGAGSIIVLAAVLVQLLQ